MGNCSVQGAQAEWMKTSFYGPKYKENRRQKHQNPAQKHAVPFKFVTI